MNNKAFRNIISFYKENFDKIEEHELYKWKAVQNFQNNWDIDADDFVNMLKISLKGTSNLLSAGNYYPRKMIIWMAEKNSKAVQEMFKNLYDLDIDFEERLENFKSRAKYLIEKYKENNVHNHYQDDRAIMVYLSLRYPEKYYLYKYTMFKDFVERTDYDDTPKSGRIETLFKFKSLCDYIHNYVMHDDELLEMYEPRRKKYYDPEYHLLVQDIIYTTYYEKEPEILETTETISLVEPIEFTQSAIKKPVLLKSSFIDYIEKEKKSKRIGDLGEQFIFFQEKEKVRRLKLSKDKVVEWTSRDKGDGLGYDILSYDENGNKMYIEVKTTQGDIDTSFYISANELEKSKLNPQNYYLYRVYQFDLENVTGLYSVYQGSLESFCITPQSYRVDFK